MLSPELVPTHPLRDITDDVLQELPGFKAVYAALKLSEHPCQRQYFIGIVRDVLILLRQAAVTPQVRDMVSNILRRRDVSQLRVVVVDQGDSQSSKWGSDVASLVRLLEQESFLPEFYYSLTLHNDGRVTVQEWNDTDDDDDEDLLG